MDLGINKWIISILTTIILALGTQVGYDYFSIKQLKLDKENLQNVIVGIDAVNQSDALRSKKNAKQVIREYSEANKSLQQKLKAIELAKEGSKNEDKCARASKLLDSGGF